MLITIKKITEVKIPNPLPGRKPITKEDVFDEAIDVWAIRSIRPFKRDKDKKSHKDITDDISVIYLKGENKGLKAPSIQVVGKWSDLIAEVNDLRGRAQQNT